MNWCQIIMSRGPVANGVVRPVPNSGYSLLTTRPMLQTVAVH